MRTLRRLALAAGLILAVALTIAVTTPARADAIGVGDVVVIGLAADNTNGFGVSDGFSWATLVDLDAGDTLFFTDSSWNIQVAGGLNGSESLIRYTVPSTGVPAGTIFLVDSRALPAGHTYDGSPETGSSSPAELSSFGDQIAVFTGTAAAPTFVFSVSTDQTQWTGSSGSRSSSRSDLYPGLADGASAVAVGAGPDPGDEHDNAYYAGPTRGDRATLLAAVADRANWVGTQDGSAVTVEDMTAGLGSGGAFSGLTGLAPAPAFLEIRSVRLRTPGPGRKHLSLTASLDVGTGAGDRSAATTLVLGDTTIHLADGDLAPRPGGRFRFTSKRTRIALAPMRHGASHYLLTASVRDVRDDSDGVFAVNYSSPDVHANGAVAVHGGRFDFTAPGGPRTGSPLRLNSVHVRDVVKDPGDEPFRVRFHVPIDGTGTAPRTAPEVIFRLGEFSQWIPRGSASFAPSPRGWIYRRPEVNARVEDGIYYVAIDYGRGQVTVAGRGIATGWSGAGDHPLRTSLGLDGAENGVEVLANSKTGDQVRY